MDAYAYVLSALRENDCRRLRGYTPEGGTRFTTWLVTVTRRLYLDHYRQKYGRGRSDEPASVEAQSTRRRLEKLLGSSIDTDQLPVSGEQSPDVELRRRELGTALEQALAQLPAQDRLLLAMRFDDDRPVREIARELRMASVFHVYRRLSVVLGTLRRILAARGVTDSEA